ncbi:hypothetical protein AB0M72_07145 [Nocardiopsis dassonvillei]
MADNDHGFSRIQREAACVFAARSRIEQAAAFCGPDAEEAGRAAAPLLSTFADRIDRDRLDGFVIELAHPRHGRDVKAVAATVRGVLTGLLRAEKDTSTDDALDGAADEHWWFRACETRWFVLAFAPCYGPTSPRHGFGSGSTYVLLQPVASFDRHATPHGEVISEQVKVRIRQEYAASGRPYDTGLAAQDVEALKFVWPLAPGLAPIRWWENTERPEAVG